MVLNNNNNNTSSAHPLTGVVMCATKIVLTYSETTIWIHVVHVYRVNIPAFPGINITPN